METWERVTAKQMEDTIRWLALDDRSALRMEAERVFKDAHKHGVAQAAQKRYRVTKGGQETRRRYLEKPDTPAKMSEAQQRYDRTAKGQESRLRYRYSDKGKATDARLKREKRSREREQRKPEEDTMK